MRMLLVRNVVKLKQNEGMLVDETSDASGCDHRRFFRIGKFTVNAEPFPFPPLEALISPS